MLLIKFKCFIKYVGFFKLNCGLVFYFWSGWYGDCICVVVF